MDYSIYKDKKVLVTGVTGFKGSWLSVWLGKLGAEVVGVADGVHTAPALFDALKLKTKIKYIQEDVRDSSAISNIIKTIQPDFVFHLAAQAIVSESKRDPLYTIETNTVGTANVLNGLRQMKKKCTAVMITSDKCYENKEWIWGYREIDELGGKDIYSASKAAAELVISAFVRTYFSTGEDHIRIATARAGNVIGGGDWSKDRVVVDCMTKWARSERVSIRSPNATRPWQHVLEPLSGYLLLGKLLSEKPELHGQSYNFGPSTAVPVKVVELIKKLSEIWSDDGSYACYKISENSAYNEAELLQLNCDKARKELEWQAILNHDECFEMVASWYKEFYVDADTAEMKTLEQIEAYEKKLRDKFYYEN